ncbi:MAG: hypothetical protein IH592_10475, partial [Bacteroidales bacterium]|nr:hypothetical protein [Bacteroidales bacterium]
MGLIISAASLAGQDIPGQYSELIRKADSLYSVREYKGSAFAFSDAFKLKGSKPTTNERYNAACSWALAGYGDSALFNLNYITTFMNYTSYGHLKSDPDLLSLHSDARWDPLLEAVQENKKKTYPDLDFITVNGFKVEVVTYGLQNNQKGKPV